MQIKLFAPALVAAAALFSACGDAATASSTTVPQNLNSTNFATLPPTISTLPPTTNPTGTPGEVTTDVTEYTLVANDVPVNVAKRFGITLEALNNANVDTAGYSAFYVGLKIKIPAGAVLPVVDPTVTTTTLAGDPVVTTPSTLAPSGTCTTGSYTIVEGDLPGLVAAKFDVTLEQLNAANANTSGYKNFIVGVKIIIPCP